MQVEEVPMMRTNNNKSIHILIASYDKSIYNTIVNAYHSQSTLFIHYASTALEALEIAKRSNIDAFVINYDHSQCNGFILADRIRAVSNYRFTPMVLIAPRHHELMAYRHIKCFAYIHEPFNEQKILKHFDKLIDFMSECSFNRIKKLRLMMKGIEIFIDLEDIIFIEYISRNIIIHTKEDVFEYKYMSLKNFKQLLPVNFLRVHKAFIINKYYIKRLNMKERYCNLDYCNKKIPLGKSYQDNYKEKLYI